jgi:integrase
VFDRRTGKRLRRTFPNLTAAKRWREDAIVALRRGELRVEQTPRIADALAELLDGMGDGRALNRSGEPYKPGTIRTYGYAVRDVLEPRFGHLRLHELRRRDVQRLVDDLRAGGASASQVRNALDPLRVVFRRAIRDELVTASPCEHLDLPALRPAEQRVPAPADVAGLLAALPEADRPLWATAFYAGLRRGELRALRWTDLDLDAGVIRVRHGWDDVEGEQAPKSRAGVRDVPVIPQLREHLIEHRRSTGRMGAALVFGRTAAVPFSTSSVHRRAVEAWKDAGLPPVGLHLARHACVSFMAAAGVPVTDAQTFAGHSDYRTTASIYTHTLPGAEAEAARRVGAFLSDAQGARQ